MFQKAKRRAVRIMLLLSPLLALFALIFLMMGDLGLVQVLQGPDPATDFERYKLKGKYVETVVDWTLGSYVDCTSETDGREALIYSDYLVQLETGHWIAVRLDADRIDEAQALTEACDLVMEGLSEDWPLGFSVRGVVVPMEEDDIHFLRRELGDEEIIPGCYGEGELLHLVLVDGEVGITGSSSTITEACVTGILALVFLAFAVFLPIYGGSRLWKRNLVRYCSRTASPDSTFEQLEAFADSTPDTGLLKISDRWLLVSGSIMIQVMDTPHVIWAYQSETKHKLYGLITIGKSFALCLATDDGKIATIAGSREKVDETLEGLYAKTNHIMVGFDPDLAQMFQRKDYQGILEAGRQIRSSSANV